MKKKMQTTKESLVLCGPDLSLTSIKTFTMTRSHWFNLIPAEVPLFISCPRTCRLPRSVSSSGSPARCGAAAAFRYLYVCVHFTVPDWCDARCVCMCGFARVRVPERDHLGHLVQAARLCVGEFFASGEENRSVDQKNDLKWKWKWERPSRKPSEMQVLSRSVGDETADGNGGIKSEGRTTWRSGNEKWEVMKADKRGRWRQRRERASCCCLTFTLSLSLPLSICQRKKDGMEEWWEKIRTVVIWLMPVFERKREAVRRRRSYSALVDVVEKRSAIIRFFNQHQR